MGKFHIPVDDDGFGSCRRARRYVRVKKNRGQLSPGENFQRRGQGGGRGNAGGGSALTENEEDNTRIVGVQRKRSQSRSMESRMWDFVVTKNKGGRGGLLGIQRYSRFEGARW